MTDQMPRPGQSTASSGPAAGEDLAPRTNAEREVMRAMRRIDFRVGQERIVVIRWNGVRAVVLTTEQA